MMFEFEFLDEDSQEGRAAQQIGGYVYLLQAVSTAWQSRLQWLFQGRRDNQAGLFKSQSNL